MFSCNVRWLFKPKPERGILMSVGPKPSNQEHRLGGYDLKERKGGIFTLNREIKCLSALCSTFLWMTLMACLPVIHKSLRWYQVRGRFILPVLQLSNENNTGLNLTGDENNKVQDRSLVVAVYMREKVQTSISVGCVPLASVAATICQYQGAFLCPKGSPPLGQNDRQV